jgi:deoxyribonuclease-2
MFIAFLTKFVRSQLSCKNPFDRDVDWYQVFKVPSIKDQIPTHVSGLGFFYRDPQIKLTEATVGLDSTSLNPLYHSMKVIYQGKKDKIGYMLISDQPANCGDKKPSDSYAHKKGVLIYDGDNGLYIEHSVPRFPNDPEKLNEYQFPSTGTIYGQAMSCVTLTKENIEKWAQGQLIEKGYVYAHNTPSWASSVAPSIPKIIAGQWNTNDDAKIFDIKAGSTMFKLFSKAGKRWGKDLYHDLIAPTLKADTYSETWSRGTGTMPTNCSGEYKSYNVLNVNFQGVKWTRMNDHSKWAVCKDYFCIGGINRQEKQLERGGGSWCIYDKEFSQQARSSIITDYEKC